LLFKPNHREIVYFSHMENFRNSDFMEAVVYPILHKVQEIFFTDSIDLSHLENPVEYFSLYIYGSFHYRDNFILRTAIEILRKLVPDLIYDIHPCIRVNLLVDRGPANNIAHIFHRSFKAGEG